RPRHDVHAEFDAAHPALLSALCDAISAALARPAEAPYPAMRRFADQAAWIQSAASALDQPPAALLSALHPPTLLQKSIATLLTHQSEWTGTATQLLKALPGAAKSAGALMRQVNAIDATDFPH
ncbi:MAG: hypothetical protein M3Y27_07970, partial [Acidobacteriota bacterium]|nr:hypothetical protein [Acidobacteriota bacterium]